MTTVVAVKLRYNPKVLWFDPVMGTYQAGDHVIVETERGREVGLVAEGAVEVTDKQIAELKSPLKPVIRALTELDYDHIDQLDSKGREAMPVFRQLIEKHGLDMKPVEIEYLFTGDKAVFYFSSDERIDFRELVRDLAASLHIRVDMRQIGVRDEARMLGGLAHCGEELCCTRLGGEFQPVSIRMAKEQDLPLNPVKISGACGRLMCCLRYEFEAYKDFKTRAPKKNALIDTPLGLAKVFDYDTPREVIHMRFESGKNISIPLKDFECGEDKTGCVRPCKVNREAIDRCASSGILLALSALDKEAGLSEAPAAEPPIDHKPTLRRRRRSSEGSTEVTTSQSEREKPVSDKTVGEKTESGKQKPRPGQRSSGLRNVDRSERSPDRVRPQGRRQPNKQQTTKQSQTDSKSNPDKQQQGDRQPNPDRQPRTDRQPNPDRQQQSGRKSRQVKPDRQPAQQPDSAESSSLGGGRKRRRRPGGSTDAATNTGKDSSQG